MKLSTKSRYAARLMVNLAWHYDKGPIGLKEISKLEGISEKYLGQLVIGLRNAQLITSVRGAKGGYLLARSPEEINLSDIVSTMEGGLEIVDCIKADQSCDRTAHCVTSPVWSRVSDAIRESLASFNLHDLANMIPQDSKIMYYI